MSEIHYGWANLPAPTHGIEIADDEDSIAYVYGQDAAAKKIATRIVDVLRGEDELTALRQQVADLRAALARVGAGVAHALPEGGEYCTCRSNYTGNMPHPDPLCVQNRSATQPQEVQP